MSHFTQDYIDFMNELAANNTREFFNGNKKRYENAVKKPFKAFTEEMIRRVAADDPKVQVEAKDCMFRIARDTRFSDDKTPYKTAVSAAISPGGRKDFAYPGVYFELRPDEVRLYGGLYKLEKDDLQTVRYHIMDNPDEFQALLDDQKFKKHFGTLHGEQNKRLPKEFVEAAEKQPLLFNKGFYYYAILPAELITNGKLADTLMEYYMVAKPMKEFLTRAIGK